MTLGDVSRRCDAAPPRRSLRVLPEPEAGLAAGILIGLRDAVDRDLAAAFTTAGVSHVVAISGWNIAIVAAAIAALTGRLGRRRRSVDDDRGDRRVRRVRGRLGVGRARRAHGRRRPAGAGDRPRGAGERGARLGRDAAPRQRSEPDRRCGLPAVVAGDGGPHRLGDAADRMDRARGPRPRPSLARGKPRRVARGPGRDAADHPRLVRPAGDPVARRQPRRRPAGRAGHGRRRRGAGGRRPRPGRSAAGRRRDHRRPGLGDPPRPGGDRHAGGRPAVRERHPGTAA